MSARHQVLLAARVLPGPAGEVVENAAVVIDDDVIAWVGPALELPSRYAGARRRDFPDATIMPGFIDAHVHLGLDGGPDPVTRMRASSDAELLVLMLRNARMLLESGVTTARDLGGRAFLDVVVREAITTGDAVGPRLLVATRPITVTGGHCWFMGGEADGADAVLTIVRKNLRAGADLVKVMATGGFSTPGTAPWAASYPDEVIAAVAAEAHRLGRRVAVHAGGTPGIRQAVAAGVDTIEHCTFLGEPRGAAASSFDAPRVFDRALAEEMGRRRIAVCPTANRNARNRLRDDPSWGAHLPTMSELGVAVVAGTDAGVAGCPHDAYADGLEALAAIGYGTEEVLAMATVHAADALGLATTTGRLAVGLAADLIVLDGDPRLDLAVARRPLLVIARGRERHHEHLETAEAA